MPHRNKSLTKDNFEDKKKKNAHKKGQNTYIKVNTFIMMKTFPLFYSNLKPRHLQYSYF